MLWARGLNAGHLKVAYYPIVYSPDQEKYPSVFFSTASKALIKKSGSGQYTLHSRCRLSWTSLSPRSCAEHELSSDDFERLELMIAAIESDIEKWFSSSIACCDVCIDEYRAKWPLAYTSDSGLQYQSLDPGAFYDGSKHTPEAVTESEFNRLLPYIECPNCGGPLGPNLFAFELPFHFEEFEHDLKRLADLASIAPFLVLTDEFAQRIKHEIFRLCSLTQPELLAGEFFRGRGVDARSASLAQFGAPPASKTREGRYNHAGRPALYLADSLLACWEECRRPTGYSVATFVFTTPLRILNLSEPEDLKGVLAPVMYSNLAAAPSDGDGWDRPEYVLTRFVSDCARVAGEDGIKYLSTRTGGGANLVLLKGHEAMSHVRVLKIEQLAKPKSRWP